MKKYTNIWLSLISYVLAFIVAYPIPLIFLPPGYIVSRPVSNLFIFVCTVFVGVGIFFGFRSIKAKESTWLGHFVILIGFICLLSPLVLFFIGARL